MQHHREALVADIKAMGKFCLCSVTLQVFELMSVFWLKNQDVQEY